MTRQLSATAEIWPVSGSFTISRGSRTEAQVVVAEITDGAHHGRGECVPYSHYGESVESVCAQIESMARPVSKGLDRRALQTALPPGAARNAIDCALWDLEAKQTGMRVRQIIGMPPLTSLTTAYTLSLGTPDSMRQAAQEVAFRPLLKVKLGGDGDVERIAAVREGAPDAELIVDANEAWSMDNFDANMSACARAGAVLIEQPLAADKDAMLADIDCPVPLCADESLHTLDDLAALRKRYDAVNIKLDKTGGLTHALELVKRAEDLGFTIMIGCMVGTSLAMAPAMLLGQRARFVDLDGPLLLARDREHGLSYDGSRVDPPDQQLWG
jgi:L-Ala-D/L-Glu epimerase / N-acetyl-D-glutamate racemase